MSALIWCPFPDEIAARAAADTLVREQLVACANMLGAMQSVFAWEGAVHEERETAVLFKTRADLLDQAVERLSEVHPYETPAVMGWRCDSVPAVTSRWLADLQPGETGGR